MMLLLKDGFTDTEIQIMYQTLEEAFKQLQSIKLTTSNAESYQNVLMTIGQAVVYNFDLIKIDSMNTTINTNAHFQETQYAIVARR